MFKKWVRALYYSFPIQLVIIHLRSNLLLLLLWMGLGALLSGYVGGKFGAQYIFLDPEYLGRIDFWSFFYVGMALGCFFLTWNLTTYLLNAHYFPFLATLTHPFTKFCVNNFLLPVLFLAFYLWHLIRFQNIHSSFSTLDIAGLCAGLFSGFLALSILYLGYFRHTNRSVEHYLSEADPNLEPGLNLSPGRRGIDLDYIKLDANRKRVDTYLTEQLRPRLVRSVAHYADPLLRRIFRHNHLNALIIQLFTIVVLMLAGWLTDHPLFRFPAAASLFLLGSVFTAFLGAVTYWFHEWRLTIILLLAILLNIVTSFDIANYRNRAYGLNYERNGAPYNYKRLLNQCSPEQVAADKAHTIKILEKWKQKAQLPDQPKPKMVILSVSGGGLRSAAWATKVVQTTDSLLDGRLLDHTVLITGASGGMFGMAYLRELQLRKLRGEPIDLYDHQHLDDISRDLLNPVAFTLVSSDLFLPWGRLQYGEHTYRKDRAYAFEEQLNENTRFRMDKPIQAYARPEAEAQIPLLFLTPSIVNDGRRLIISPQPVSYMTVAPIGVTHRNTVEVDAVDFHSVFREQEADSLRFLTALRMNATYPYILPNVHLPSDPEIEVMDAGFRDNYGLNSATRFIQVFRTWIQENTSGVVLIQISSSKKNTEIKAGSHKGVISSLLDPLGIPGQLLSLQEFEQDNNLGFVYDLLGPDQFELIRFMYRPGRNEQIQASISFHLTEREKKVIINDFLEADNQASLRRVISLLAAPEERDGLLSQQR